MHPAIANIDVPRETISTRHAFLQRSRYDGINRIIVWEQSSYVTMHDLLVLGQKPEDLINSNRPCPEYDMRDATLPPPKHHPGDMISLEETMKRVHQVLDRVRKLGKNRRDEDYWVDRMKDGRDMHMHARSGLKHGCWRTQDPRDHWAAKRLATSGEHKHPSSKPHDTTICTPPRQEMVDLFEPPPLRHRDRLAHAPEYGPFWGHHRMSSRWSGHMRLIGGD
jgi:hypothetical protein